MKKEDKIDLNNYGDYRLGLTMDEVDTYLRSRAKGTKYSKWSTKQLRKRFSNIAGINTMAVIDEQVLMYREDAQRFADLMLLGKETYWD